VSHANPFYVAPTGPPVSPFGAIKTGTDVRDAFRSTLIAWMPTYLAEVARQAGLVPLTPGQPALAPVRSWKVVTDFNSIPDDAMPAAMVSSTGTVGRPERRAGGITRATWALDCSIVVNGIGWDDTAARVGWYIGAARAAVAQHGSLGDFAQDTMWVSENYGRIPSAESRTLGAGVVTFTVAVESVMTIGTGPAAPDPPLAVPGAPDVPPTLGDPDTPPADPTNVRTFGVTVDNTRSPLL